MSPRQPEQTSAFLRKERKKEKKLAKQRLQQAIKNPSFDIIDRYQLQEQDKVFQSVEESVDDSEMGNALKAHYNKHSIQQMEQVLQLQNQTQSKTKTLPRDADSVGLAAPKSGITLTGQQCPSPQDSKLFMADSKEGPNFKIPVSAIK